MSCLDCPRECAFKSFCGKEEGYIRIAKVMNHLFEEPLICPDGQGCGALFFSFCSLKCAYCQNYQISHLGQGKDYTKLEVEKIINELSASSVATLDLVTPTHYTSYLIDILKNCRPPIPVVWNTSGYERAQNIEKLADVVDIFLFDFKYFDHNLSLSLSKVRDYFDVCISAIKKAREVIGQDIIENGIMKKGIIVRHLILPGHTDDSIKVFEKLKECVGTDVYISLMSQFSPYYKATDCGLDRKITPLEYKKVLLAVQKLGFNKGFTQDLSSAEKCYTPDFDSQR